MESRSSSTTRRATSWRLCPVRRKYGGWPAGWGDFLPGAPKCSGCMAFCRLPSSEGSRRGKAGRQAAGLRRVIVSTSIAETSLTVPGVRTVADSGWSRLSRFHPATGLDRLVTERVSQSSADQRRGQGGAVGPRGLREVLERIGENPPATRIPRFSGPTSRASCSNARCGARGTLPRWHGWMRRRLPHGHKPGRRCGCLAW